MVHTRSWRAVLSYGLGAMLALHSLGILIPSVIHAASPTLKISEINWAGAVGDPNDQWIELENNDVSAITFTDATPYTITVGSPVTDTITLDGSYGTLNPGQFLVISRESLAVSTINMLAGAAYHEDATMALPTVAAEYHVFDDTAAEVDAITDAGSGLPFAGTAPATGVRAATMTRMDIAALGSNPANWYTARTIGAGFDVSAPEQYGTPGAENVDLALPTGGVTPVGNTTLASPAMVSGMVTLPETQATVTFTRVSHDPSVTQFTQSYLATAGVGGDYTVTASAPALLAGRYAITVFASDADGNRSRTTTLFNGPASTDTNYEVLADVSAVPTPVLGTLPTLTNQPTVTVAGSLDAGTTYNSLEVLRNGMYYGTFPVSGSAFSFPVILKLNASNHIQVVGVKDTGEFSLPAEATVVNDSTAPDAVDLTKVTLNANQPGTEDSFLGNAGAAEAGTTLSVYGDAALTKLIATLTVQPDGSFAKVGIGDNKYSSVYLVLEDAAGNLSSVAKLDNPTGFTTATGALSPTVTDLGQSQVTVTWTKVDSAVRYRVKYKVAGGSYGATTDMCLTGNASCAFSTTITGLFTDTDYVFAIAGVDKYGNVSAYEETAFHTKAVPVVITPVVAEVPATPAPTTKPKATDVVTKATPTPTPSASPSPTEKGDVKSESTVSTNWTPWIVLAVLVAIAVLATAGYFYWFGGEAGEAALASVLAEREKRKEEEEKQKGSKPKPGGKDRRW